MEKLKDMPLDAQDYEKIQAIIDRVVNPLVQKVDTIYGGLLPRVEYESRHRHLEQAIVDIRQDIRDLRTNSHDERTRMQDDTKKLWEEVDALKEDISNQRITTIRYMVGAFVAFFMAIIVPLILKLH